MKALFVNYPKCSTCIRAGKWLEAEGVDFVRRNIKEEKPTAEELRAWKELADVPLKKFFNTSGLLYKEMKLKDRLPDMTEDEMYGLLAEDGMLVKRPILVLDGQVLVGFREEEWREALRRSL